MRKSRFSIRFAQDPLTLFLFSLVLMTTPLSWVVAWFVCVAVHELGHLLMAWLLSVRVYGMTLGIWGASIEMDVCRCRSGGGMSVAVYRKTVSSAGIICVLPNGLESIAFWSAGRSQDHSFDMADAQKNTLQTM